MPDYTELKLELYKLCEHYVRKRLETAQEALSSTQESSNQEEKSTAGDKHDTERAMMQIQVEQLTKQLAEANKLAEELKRVDYVNKQTVVTQGAIVFTSQNNYFMSISAGKIKSNQGDFFAVSMTSPIAQALKGKSANDELIFNGKKIQIEAIF